MRSSTLILAEYLVIPKIGRPPKTIEERFWPKVDIRGEDECWPWKAALMKGYGAIKRKDGMQLKAHRVSYEIHNGPIPEGMLVCHSCDNPCCVNPKHLWLGTWKTNQQDCVSKGRRSDRTGPNNPMFGRIPWNKGKKK